MSVFFYALSGKLTHLTERNSFSAMAHFHSECQGPRNISCVDYSVYL